MLSPGQIVAGKYRVDRQLGAGGMGAVYVATNMVLEKQVALKVMGAEFQQHADWVQRFFREGVAASKVRHPGVVQVFDAGDHDGAPWMAMELLEGESLGERLQRVGRLGPEETARVMTGVLGALDAVHSVGVVHRDLKPDNIFLERTAEGERTKVLDFGIAKEAEAIHGLTATGTIVGTAHYIAPEQARDSKTVDPRTDLYAMGVILFECLSGQMPYEADTVPELIAKMYSEPPRELGRLAPHVPAPLARVVHACLARDPSHRPQSARALSEALTSALSPDAATGPVSRPSPVWQSSGLAPSGTAVLSSPAHSPPPTRAAPVAAAAPRRSIWPWVIGGVVVLGLGVLGTLVAIVGLGVWTAASVAEGIAEGGGGFGVTLDFDLPEASRVPMWIDVTDDGVEDLLGAVMRYEGDEMISHFAAYDGVTGRRLWLSEELGPVDSRTHGRAALAEDTLLYATPNGTLYGYDVTDGRPRWQFNLGERVETFCAAGGGQAIAVLADDARRLIQLSDGASRPAEAGACGWLMTDALPSFSQEQTLTAWTARDRFGDTEVEGMTVAAAFDDPAGARMVAIGQRRPGTGSPRVALVSPSGGWISEVPGVSPLSAEADDPAATFIADDAVFLAYAMEGDAPARVTAIALDGGRRLWDQPLSESRFDPRYVIAGRQRVAVGHGGHVDVYDRASGAHVFHVGR